MAAQPRAKSAVSECMVLLDWETSVASEQRGRVLARTARHVLYLQQTVRAPTLSPLPADRRYANSITSSSVVVKRVLHQKQLVSILAFSAFFAPPTIFPHIHMRRYREAATLPDCVSAIHPTAVNGAGQSPNRTPRLATSREGLSISWLDSGLVNLPCRSQNGVIAADA